MTTESAPTSIARPGRPSSPPWLQARALWAGVSIVTMWLAVLLVGIFGGDFVSSSASNGFTKIPDVIFMLPFVLPATIVVARRGLSAPADEVRGASGATPQAVDQMTVERPSDRTRSAA